MLKTIESIIEYRALYNKYVVLNKAKGITNFFVNERNIIAFINDRRIKFDVVDGALFLFVEENDYYKMYFYGLTTEVRQLPAADKNICCDIFDQKENKTHVFLYNLFLNNNFVCKQKYEQVRLCYGKLHKIALGYLEKNKWKLEEHNMRIAKLKLTEKLEFEQFVIDNMGQYDGFSIEDPDWEEQIKNNNVVGIYILDKLIAAYYFTEKAGRVIVEKKYRGRNLSVLLRMYFAAQKRWSNSSKNQYGWVEENNISSKKTFEKLFAVYTRKIKYRYLRDGL